MVACMLRIFAAAATPWAWLPEENATTPPPRSFCGIDDNLLKAPRNLNEPVRCSISGFRNTLAPTRSLSTGGDKSGVRTANGATTRAAASISDGLMGRTGDDIVICVLYRVQGRTGKIASSHATRMPGQEIHRIAFRRDETIAFRRNGTNLGHILDKRARGGLPGMPRGEFDASFRRDFEGRKAGGVQILAQGRNRRRADDIAGTRDRQAAGERFEQHETECVGPARKHEN